MSIIQYKNFKKSLWPRVEARWDFFFLSVYKWAEWIVTDARLQGE